MYTSESLALATLEVLVHLQASKVLSSYSVFRVHFDERIVTSVDRASLPKNWRAYPASRELHAIGDRWFATRASVALKVPSAIIDTENNYLINPAHANFSSLVIDPPERFTFDPRLLGH